jgi:hypothetical protein
MGRRGTIDAVAALSGGRFTDEVTDIFTTARWDTLGNGRYRLSVTATQMLLSKTSALWRVATLA